jgi:hypothetical protein
MTGKCIVAALLFAGVLAAPAFAADNFSGTWDINGRVRLICSFTQKDKVLTGNCKGPLDQGPISGNVDGKSVNWIWAAQTADSVPHIGEFSGQWDLKNAITGQWTEDTGATAQAPAGAVVIRPSGRQTFIATWEPAK